MVLRYKMSGMKRIQTIYKHGEFFDLIIHFGVKIDGLDIIVSNSAHPWGFRVLVVVGF